jgi:CheY-like chemotaxis protein
MTMANNRIILVIDDHQDQADTLCTLLELHNNETHVAYDAIEGMRLAHAIVPNIILLDIGMPGLDGYKTVRELRKDSALAGTLIVAVTGWADDGHRMRAHKSGFDLHCRKPVELKDLQEIFDQATLKNAPQA